MFKIAILIKKKDILKMKNIIKLVKNNKKLLAKKLKQNGFKGLY